MDIVSLVEESQMKKDIPDFAPGDRVRVHYKVVEGGRERIQVYEGTVIGRQRGGARETFTVRRDIVGAERVFPLHSPHLAFVRTVTSHRVRRAKLHYLRKRVGKATRLVEDRRETDVAASSGGRAGEQAAGE